MGDRMTKTDALVADLRALVKSWEPLHGGWEYGTAVLAVLQEHGYDIPAEPRTGEPACRAISPCEGRPCIAASPCLPKSAYA